MLTVYTYPISRPPGSIDLATVPLDTLAESALAVLAHQKTATIWFGYLDGWMLTPQEEVRLRAVIRAFPCVVVSQFPLSFSLAWKNEMDWIYTPELHGNSDSHNDGGVVHNGSSLGYNTAGAVTSSHGDTHQT